MCAEARGRSVLPYSLSSPPARPACQQLGSSSPPAPGAAESLSSSAVRQQLARQLASSSPPVPAARQQLAQQLARSSLAAQQLTSSAKAPPPGPNSGPPPGPNSGHGVFACPGMVGEVIPDHCSRAARYQILGGTLAKGAHGEVYVAWDTTDGTIVALKKQPAKSESATRELNTYHSLPQHPNVLSILDAFVGKGAVVVCGVQVPQVMP